MGLIASALVGDALAGVTKNLGTVGTVYPVIEQDVTVQLKERAGRRSVAEQHRLLRESDHYRPRTSKVLPRAGADRNFLVDMSYTLDHDLKDGEGSIVYPAGYTFNPLDYVPFSMILVIIDGRDSDQVEWFRKSSYADDHRTWLLLAGGQARPLSGLLKRPVYYLTDIMARRLHVTAVPSVVVREGDRLRVREFKPVAGERDEKR